MAVGFFDQFICWLRSNVVYAVNPSSQPIILLPNELAASAYVTIRIYDVNGRLVRQLEIGKQKAGRYLDKEKATYWNGKDQLGQSVSSGLYFYTLRAGGFDGFDTQATQPKDFVATRRMVILK